MRPRRPGCALVNGLLLGLLFAGSVCRLDAGDGQAPPASQAAAEVAEVAKKGNEQEWRFTDIEGEDHAPFADESVEIMVVVFIATDCPIANYYQPTIKRLADRYTGKGVRFLLFHPDPDATLEELREHAEAFKIESPVFADSKFALARRLKAGTTPEAFVIARDGLTKYRGRIDDTYVAWGKRRRAPGSKDLQDALDAVLLGKPVPSPVTKPIGCYIPLGLTEEGAAADGGEGSE